MLKKVIPYSLLFLLAFSSCKKNQTTVNRSSQEITYDTYSADWLEVDKMEKKGLGKAIIKKTDSILSKALRENNINQIFKALAYRSKYSNNIEEESTLKILNSYEGQIERVGFPIKQILHSATAELYYQYYNQNRWRFNQRTVTKEFDEKDLRSWSLDKILTVVKQHYLASLRPTDDLSQFPTSSLKTILISDKNNGSFNKNKFALRPSLYDFLADRALHYFKRDEGRISKPIDEFNIDEYPIFSSPSIFSQIEFQSKDTLSNQLHSAKLYQELIFKHLNDTDPNVLINFELERLQHFYITSNNELKDSLYLNALFQLSEQYSSQNSVDEIDFKIAQFYFQQGSLYDPKNPDDRKKWHIKKAYEICKSKENLKSFGAAQCKVLLESIENSSFSFHTEDTYLPEEPILFRFQYKNIDHSFFRLVKLPYNHTPENNRMEFLNYLTTLKPIRNWKTKLPVINDFRQHSTELYTEGLSKGNYYLLASSDSTFNLKENDVAFANVKISSLSYFSRQTSQGNEVEIFVRNRENGLPINGAEISAYTDKYNYSSRSHSLEKIGSFKADKNGYCKFSSTKQREAIRFSIYSNGDTLTSYSNYYLYNRNQEIRKSIQARIFTDRAIYRPGQTVHFKCIYIESDGNNKVPKTAYKNELMLFNVNGQKLSSLKLTTNEYGSVQGSFILPNSGLNGQYRIQSKHGSQYFSVEEYKRPTFKIELDTSTAQNRINEKVDVSGKVETFSGISLSNSQLRYRVIRRAKYPFWPLYRSFYPPSNEKEIANGLETTDDKGQFNFQFLAQADPSIQSKWSPVYHYQVILEATSIQGETQSLNHTIKLSNQSIYLSSSINDNIQLEDLKNLIIKAENIDGKRLNVEANLSLWKLKTPNTPKKRKLWGEVDQTSISAKEFEDKFPNYTANEEYSVEIFKKDYEITNSLIECNEPIKLFRSIKPGAYEIEINTKDQFGNLIQWKKRFVLYDEKSKSPSYPVFDWLNLQKSTIEVGDTAKILFASSLNNLKLFYEIEHKNKIIKQQWLDINKEQKRIKIPIQESFRGGISIHFTAVHSNRMIHLSRTIKVPYTNKKLNVKLATYRDKTSPGSNEKWKLKISGYKKEGLTTELLASMYDQSLDQFAKKDWELSIYNQNYPRLKWDLNQSFSSNSSQTLSYRKVKYAQLPTRSYPSLNWFGFSISYANARYYNKSMPMMAQEMSDDVDYETASAVLQSEDIINENADEIGKVATNIENSPYKHNPIRSDFRETVFFFPQLRTDEEGEISFEFKVPDALTQWKFRALAHTQDLKIGSIEKSIISQKKLMIVPNTPRFFREGDELIFKAMISNLDSNRLNGYAKLRFYDATHETPIDIFPEESADLPFELNANENKVVSWKIKIPKGIEAIRYKIIAETKKFSDGEEKIIPVLKNRKLVTESLPLWLRGQESRSFSFEKLLASASMKELSHESFTIEFTPNPAWYAIQALPTLTNNGNECTEKAFARLYANSIAEKIANRHPRIKSVFEQWKSLNSSELTSKLMQNQELKSIVIEETPWLKKAQSESEQKQKIALLFDYNHMAQEKKEAINKLIELQLPNGGWSWYKGMRDNRYITQYIIEGLGHLIHLGIDVQNNPALSKTLEKGIKYLDNRLIEDFQRLIDHKAKLNNNHLNSIQIHYLYTRSFFPEIPLPKNFKAFDYYLDQAENFWLDKNLLEQGMIALAVSRWKKNSQIPQQIISSLTDNALFDEEMGMYWKKNSGGYYWHQSAIETQALLIELYKEVGSSPKIVEELKIWLLKQKQTQSWSNSKATAKACYALLMNNAPLINEPSQFSIKVGKETVEFSSKEEGTSYVKKVWKKENIKKDFGNIHIEKKDEGIAWGAAYWQYYQDLDKITAANESGLKLNKKLFKSYMTDQGELMKPIDESEIKVGDKIKVRIELESDRNLEFVHLKDMRASAFEPTNVISTYKFQDGLGYYESTKDASTNFFIDWLPKGLYVFEYDLRASQEGDFSNGISSIQCQYAPEFSSHSIGRRVKIMPQ